MSEDKDTWNEWARYVLEEIKSLKGNSVELSRELKHVESRIQDRLMTMQLDVHGLKIKMILIGVLVGSATTIFLELFVKKLVGSQ